MKHPKLCCTAAISLVSLIQKSVNVTKMAVIASIFALAEAIQLQLGIISLSQKSIY